MARALAWLSVQAILVGFIHFGTGGGQSGSYYI